MMDLAPFSPKTHLLPGPSQTGSKPCFEVGTRNWWTCRNRS